MDTLTKNLSFIEKNNKVLCNKIKSITSYSKVFELNTNLCGQYNLLINQKPVHSITNAETEIQDIIKNLKHNSNTSLHIIYGIGLGYALDGFVNNAKGTIIVYEPDVETLHFVLSTVDFTENFRSKKVYIVSDYNELDTAFTNLYKYKTNATLSFLDYYKLYHKQELDDFQIFIQKKVKIYSHNYEFQVKNNFNFFRNTLKDLDKKYNYPLLANYKDIFKDKPALIVSAGPSLNKNIEIINKHQNNMIIFCVGTALKTLYKNGITPDFVNVIERRNTFVHYDLPCTKDTNLIVEPFTESSYFNTDFKNILYTASLETDDARWFLEKAEKEFVHFETKGTVAYHAIYSANYLGCNPIILIGQDLAYTDGQCYAKGSEFDGLQCVFDEIKKSYKIVLTDFDKYKNAYFKAHPNVDEEKKIAIINKRLEELNRNICTVQGQDNNLLPTDAVYSLFINYIEDFAQRYNQGKQLINASIGGALIKGFQTLPLDKAISQFAVNSLNKNILTNKLNNKNNNNIDKIAANIKKDYTTTQEIIKKLEKGVNILECIKSEIENKQYSSKSASIVSKLAPIFTDITNNYMFKSRIVKIILFKEFMELDYVIREYENIDSQDTALKYIEVYYNYFKNGLKKALYVESALKKTLEELNK